MTRKKKPSQPSPVRPAIDFWTTAPAINVRVTSEDARLDKMRKALEAALDLIPASSPVRLAVRQAIEASETLAADLDELNTGIETVEAWIDDARAIVDDEANERAVFDAIKDALTELAHPCAWIAAEAAALQGRSDVVRRVLGL